MAPLQAILEKVRTQPPNILAALQAVQAEQGYVDPANVPLIAQSLGVTDSDVHGVLSFYHDLRTEPPGRHHIRFCLGDSCIAMKAEQSLEALQKTLKCGIGETTRDGKYTLDKVYCLGNCANSPAMLVDGEVHGNLTPKTVASCLSASALKRELRPASGLRRDDVRYYISNDISALSKGADRVAAALSKKGATVVRTSSRGAFFLEPLVETDGPDGRIGWANASEKDVAKILTGKGGQPVDKTPFIAKQQRFTFARAGLIDPLSIEDFKARGGFRGLQKAIALDPQKIIDEMKASGLRGRGGAAFPAGVKWQTTKDAPADQKYVVANADEGDPGTYSDRMIMEGEPYRLIEGMAICARAVGATKGYIYARSEYPHAIRKLRAAIARATEAGWLGHKIQGAAFDFELEVFMGAGAYICGEETALLESLEGKRGMVRPKPPFPAIEGLHKKPTVVNNVITFASAPDILDRGGAWHASMGTEKSKGTMPLQLAGCIKQGGLVEVPFGVTLEEVIYEFGGGLPKGSKFKAVQVGGPLGSIFPEKLLKTPICFDEFAKAGGILGHGGIVVFDHETNMVDLARHFMEFTAEESCGKCTPCRVGSTRAKEILEQIRDGQGRPEDLETLKDLSDTMKMTSLCALGGLAPYPVLTALQYFPKEFERRPRNR